MAPIVRSRMLSQQCMCESAHMETLPNCVATLQACMIPHVQASDCLCPDECMLLEERSCCLSLEAQHVLWNAVRWVALPHCITLPVKPSTVAHL